MGAQYKTHSHVSRCNRDNQPTLTVHLCNGPEITKTVIMYLCVPQL